MSENIQSEYFSESRTVIEKNSADSNESGSSAMDDLINQNIIKVNDYHKIKAKKRVIRHVHFKPD